MWRTQPAEFLTKQLEGVRRFVAENHPQQALNNTKWGKKIKGKKVVPDPKELVAHLFGPTVIPEEVVEDDKKHSLEFLCDSEEIKKLTEDELQEHLLLFERATALHREALSMLKRREFFLSVSQNLSDEQFDVLKTKMPDFIIDLTLE